MKRINTLLLASALIIQSMVLLAPLWWFFELFTHYAHYYAALGGLLTTLFVLQKHWKTVLIMLTLTCMNLATISPYLSHKAQPTKQSEADLRILSQNVYFKNENLQDIEQLIQKEDPDLFIIHEAMHEWQLQNYPYSFFLEDNHSPFKGATGFALGSKIPGSFKTIPLADSFGIEFKPEDQNYTLLAVHPYPPIKKEWQASQKMQLKAIQKYAQEQKGPLIIAGDFNATPWSPQMNQLLEKAELQNARFINTWHAHRTLFKIPIDHILTSKNLHVLSTYRTRKSSADHYGVVAELAIELKQ